MILVPGDCAPRSRPPGTGLLLRPLFSPCSPGDAIAECKAFFEKFQKCVDGLKGDDQEDARIFMKTLRATLGMSDDFNQVDPTALGIMCGFTIEEMKKEPSIQKYNCFW